MTTASRDARLARARALVVGVGGLGAPAALALAEAGVGTLGLADPDTVEISNLHRQPLYDGADVGRAKVEVAAARLRATAPAVAIETWGVRLDASHARLVAGFDVVLDGTDSIAAKFLVNDLCVATGVPLVHAGVLGWRAQCLTVVPGRSACFRCVFEAPPPPDETPSCEQAGVLGPVPVLAGALQAAEALRVLAGAPAWIDRVVTADLLSGRHRAVPVRSAPGCGTCAGAGRDAALTRHRAG